MPDSPTAAATKKSGPLDKVLEVVGNLLVAILCGLTFGFTTIGFFYSMLADSVVGARDFVVYWATGQQLAHHLNPYDRVALLHIERAAGLADRYGAMFMRNPPTALLLAYPLGFLGLRVASVAWPTALALCLVGSVYILWVMFGRRGGHRHWIGYSFAPALICLINGQAALFALLGLAVFLRLHRTRPFLAGLALWLCTTKPHLFLPFGLVLIAWIVVTRNYRLLAGSLVAILGSFWVTWTIDPQGWAQYAQMVHTSGIEHEFIPCVSVLMRVWIPPHGIWQQYVLGAIASIWALVYYWRHRAEWNWLTHGSLLMLVSIVAAPYSWLFDQGLAIPALLQGAYFTRSRKWVIFLAILSALVEVAMFGNIWKPSAVYLWTMWTAPAWLIWYILAIDSANWKDGWPSWRVMNWIRGRRIAAEPALVAAMPAGGAAPLSIESPGSPDPNR